MMLRLSGHAVAAGHGADFHSAIGGGVIVHEFIDGGSHGVFVERRLAAFGGIAFVEHS